MAYVPLAAAAPNAAVLIVAEAVDGEQLSQAAAEAAVKRAGTAASAILST